MKLIAAAILNILIAQFAFAGSDIVGKWKTIDDETGKPRSIVSIEQENGEYVGHVEKIFYREGEAPDPICDKCHDEFKDKKVIGLKFLWGFKKNDDKYEGGKILDPKNGKIYSCRIKVLEDGKVLDVRGFIGISLIGRSQKWEKFVE